MDFRLLSVSGRRGLQGGRAGGHEGGKRNARQRKSRLHRHRRFYDRAGNRGLRYAARQRTAHSGGNSQSHRLQKRGDRRGASD